MLEGTAQYPRLVVGTGPKGTDLQERHTELMNTEDFVEVAQVEDHVDTDSLTGNVQRQVVVVPAALTTAVAAAEEGVLEAWKPEKTVLRGQELGPVGMEIRQGSPQALNAPLVGNVPMFCHYSHPGSWPA